MTAPKSPIESFGPELLNTLIAGSKQRFEISCKWSIAVRLRLRIHQLRTQMRRMKHELYPIVAKTKVSITWDEKAVETYTGARGLKYPKSKEAPVKVIIAPHDDDFAELLKSAGIDAKRDVSGLLTPKPPEPIADPKAPDGDEGTGLEALIFNDGEDK